MIRKAPAAGQVAVCHECMIAGERIESTHHAACQRISFLALRRGRAAIGAIYAITLQVT